MNIAIAKLTITTFLAFLDLLCLSSRSIIKSIFLSCASSEDIGNWFDWPREK